METEEKTATKAIKGGEFLIKETDANDIFIPEQWDEEQLMIAQTNRDFIEKEIWPILDRIDSQEEVLPSHGQGAPFLAGHRLRSGFLSKRG